MLGPWQTVRDWRRQFRDVIRRIGSRTSGRILFFIGFFLFWVTLLSGSFIWFRVHVDPGGNYRKMTAAAVGWSAALFGADVIRLDCQITLDGFPVEVVDECTGIFELILFLSAVLAFSSGIRSKAVGAIIGAPLILVMNLARMVTLLYAGANSEKLFEFLHVYMWQTSYVIFVGLMFIGWLTLVVSREKTRTAQISA